MKTTKTLLKLAMPVVLGAAAVSVQATGFRLPDQDAFATARGEAFAATADNPSAIYYNPAGITQLEGHNVRGGVYGLSLRPSYTSPITGQSFDNEKDLHAVPQFFYTYTPHEYPLSFGLGLYSPYGLSSRWAQDSGFRTIATEASLTYFTINPVVAWKVCPQLSLAAGLTVNYAEMDLRQGLFWPTQPWDGFKFKGDGWDLGYNLGLLWKPHEKVAVGITFRSTTTVDLEGHTESFNDVAIPAWGIPASATERVGAKVEMPFPLSAVFAISYRPTPAWNLEFDADFTDWSRLGTVTVAQERRPVLLPTQNVPLNLQWESSWYYEFGATRYLNDRWSISAGYIFNENSVPDQYYLPVVADLDRHFFSVGVGFKGERLTLDAAYQFGYGPARTVSGSALSATGQSADGKYEFLSHALLVSLGWRF